MAVTEQAAAIVAAERAVGLLTGFALTLDVDDNGDPDPVAGEAFFSIIDELAFSLREAQTDEEVEAAREGFSNAIIMMASIAHPLIDHCAECYGIDKFDFIRGLAQELYGSLG